MPEDIEGQEQPLVDDSSLSAEGIDSDISDLGEALGQETLDGFREKPAVEMLEELDLLEKKIEALIAHCDKLALVNANLAQQLAKERESKARLQDLNDEARRRVDKLIQRLRDLEEAEK